MKDKHLPIEDLDTLINMLQTHRQNYGNVPVHMDMSSSKSEGVYKIDSVLYSTDEDGKQYVSLISW
jgi:translation initiation factor 2 alpha subunit (eIF-2alpha)